MKRIMLQIVAIYFALALFFNTSAFAQRASAADVLFEAGKEYYQQGNYQMALHEFEKALMADPGHADALMYIQIIKQEHYASEEKTGELKDFVNELEHEEAIDQSLERAEQEFIAEEIAEPVVEAPMLEPEVKEAPAPTVAQAPAQQPKEAPEEPLQQETPYQLLGQGKTFIECYNKYYWHDTQFNGSGDRTRWAYNGRGREVVTELKIEHGLTENLTLLGSIPYKMAIWKDDYNRNATSGIGNIWMKAKYKIWDQWEMPFTFYAQPGIRVPGGYDDTESPALGTGEVAAELRLVGVRSCAPFPGYTKVETGYRLRADEYTDEIPYFWELGWHPVNWLLFKATVDGIEGLPDTGDSEEDYTKWTAHAVFSPKGGFGAFREPGVLNFELMYGNTFRGKNTSNGSEVVFNITYQF